MFLSENKIANKSNKLWRSRVIRTGFAIALVVWWGAQWLRSHWHDIPDAVAALSFLLRPFSNPETRWAAVIDVLICSVFVVLVTQLWVRQRLKRSDPFYPAIQKLREAFLASLK